MRRLVISAPRSGLNWLRFCTEKLTGQPTPGKLCLVETGTPYFERSHDALGLTRGRGNAWSPPQHDHYDCCALLLRDPYELGGRQKRLAATRQSLGVFGRLSGRILGAPLGDLHVFAGNIVYFDEQVDCRKAVFYYEDFSSDADVMAGLLAFLNVDTDRGFEFDDLRLASKRHYDRTHAAAGGTMSGEQDGRQPAHAHVLTQRDRRRITRHLASTLGTVRLHRFLGRYLAQ